MLYILANFFSHQMSAKPWTLSYKVKYLFRVVKKNLAGNCQFFCYVTYIVLCDQAKWVWSRSNSILIFLVDCIHPLQSYLLQQTPLKLVNWFQRYRQLQDCKNNRSKDITCFDWLYLKINICEFWLILLDHITPYK